MNKPSEFDVLRPYTIEGLRQRQRYNGGIRIKDEATISSKFKSYLIEYPSGMLKITGILNVPTEGFSHAVIILNHGYVPPKHYKSGSKTAEIAKYLASGGYLTISPDFRGWGGSDSGENFFRSGLVIDVLNLIDALPSLPTADPKRVGLWGHSMGAGIALKVIAIDDRIKASVLCAPLSFHDAEILSKWNDVTIEMETNKSDSIFRIYRKALENPDFLWLTSPCQYMHYITGAVQIHTGTEDKVASPKWADEIYRALEALGKNTEIYRYPGQGHYLKGDDLNLMFRRCKAFFDRYI